MVMELVTQFRSVLRGMNWLVVLLALASRGYAAGYENDFEKLTAGSVPEDFLVLDGGFTVKEEEGNKFLELPGAPLESFGLLFGPNDTVGQRVSGRILSSSKGRRSPTFGLGINGVSGFKLQLSPAKKVVELLRGEALVTSAPFEWASGKWTLFKLQLRKAADGSHRVEGKVWLQGSAEPKEWTIGVEVKDLPPAGRASLNGSPYAGTPIRYDDLKVDRAGD